MVVCAERRHARLTPSERSGAADYVIQRLRDEEHSLQLLTADYTRSPGPDEPYSYLCIRRHSESMAASSTGYVTILYLAVHRHDALSSPLAAPQESG